MDINNIRAALKKLYEDGAISAEQYNAELKRANDQQAELKRSIEKTATAGKQAGEQLTRSQEMYNEALKDSILTSEELRRISGQRMEEERRASGEAMERNRKGKEVAERDMSAMENWFGGVMSRARAPLAAMSAAALALFDKLRGVNQAAEALDTSNVENTARSLKQVTDSLGELQKASANPMMGSLGRWAVETQLASAATQKKFLEEKLALQRLTEQYASGAIGAREFNAQANRLRGTLTLLDEADLSQLDSSIASAQQRMQQLGESSRSIWESLQDELDKLEGREVDIEARRMASRKRELEAQLEAAKADGDATSIGNLQRALQTLAQIQTVTEQQAANAAAKKLSEERAQQAQSQPQKTTPAQVIRLESKGKAVDIALNDKTDQTALLSILEDAGLRSL